MQHINLKLVRAGIGCSAYFMKPLFVQFAHRSSSCLIFLLAFNILLTLYVVTGATKHIFIHYHAPESRLQQVLFQIVHIRCIQYYFLIVAHKTFFLHIVWCLAVGISVVIFIDATKISLLSSFSSWLVSFKQLLYLMHFQAINSTGAIVLFF